MVAILERLKRAFVIPGVDGLNDRGALVVSSPIAFWMRYGNVIVIMWSTLRERYYMVEVPFCGINRKPADMTHAIVAIKHNQTIDGIDGNAFAPGPSLFNRIATRVRMAGAKSSLVFSLFFGIPLLPIRNVFLFLVGVLSVISRATLGYGCSALRIVRVFLAFIRSVNMAAFNPLLTRGFKPDVSMLGLIPSFVRARTGFAPGETTIRTRSVIMKIIEAFCLSALATGLRFHADNYTSIHRYQQRGLS